MNAVLAEDVLDYAVLFAEIADAYFEREMYAELELTLRYVTPNTSFLKMALEDKQYFYSLTNSCMHEDARRTS